MIKKFLFISLFYLTGLVSCSSHSPYEIKSPCVTGNDIVNWYKSPCIRKPIGRELV